MVDAVGVEAAVELWEDEALVDKVAVVWEGGQAAVVVDSIINIRVSAIAVMGTVDGILHPIQHNPWMRPPPQCRHRPRKLLRLCRQARKLPAQSKLKSHQSQQRSYHLRIVPPARSVVPTTTALERGSLSLYVGQVSLVHWSLI
jgi:hypothetical protein